MRRSYSYLAALGLTVLLGLIAFYASWYVVEGVYAVEVSEARFRFERPWAALLAVGALLAFFGKAFLRDAAPRLLVSRGFELGRVSGSWRLRLRPLLIALRTVTVLLLVGAMMGPQSIHARDRATIEGIDIVLALDVSLSMRAADIQPTRFEATKNVVDDFILRRPSDRIGAVIFGRDAFTLLPLTTDKDALRGMVQELELGMVDGRGTAIGNAVGTALNRLRGSDAESKIIILLTDGDSNSGNISPEQAADFATTMGVKVFTILMGQTAEARAQTGVDLFNRGVFDVGNYPVRPELLQNMAVQTGGEYFQVADRAALISSFHKILNALEKSEIEDTGKVYGELFPAFLVPGLIMLGVELLLAAFVFRRWP